MMTKNIWMRIVALAVPLALVGCVQFKASMLSVEKQDMPVKLHKLEIAELPTQSLFLETVQKQTNAFTLFQRELTSNLMSTEYAQQSYGTIRMVEIASYVRPAKVLTIASLATLFSLNVLGMPLARLKVDVEYEFVIDDPFGREVKRYCYMATAKQPMWIYYGKYKDVLKIEAIKDVLGQFRDDVKKDALQINGMLECARAEMDSISNSYRTAIQ